QPITTPVIQYSKRARIAQSSALLTMADEPASPVRDDRVKVLEDREGVATKQSGDDAPIKGRSINEGEAAAERISNDSEEIVRVLTSMDASTVLAGGINVPNGSGFIPTTGYAATSLVEPYQSSFCLALKMCVPAIVLHHRLVTYTASGNSLLAGGMPCAFYSQQQQPRVVAHRILSPGVIVWVSSNGRVRLDLS
nr:hypothetical protein [Tanacetum cinerariifolium]